MYALTFQAYMSKHSTPYWYSLRLQLQDLAEFARVRFIEGSQSKICTVKTLAQHISEQPVLPPLRSQHNLEAALSGNCPPVPMTQYERQICSCHLHHLAELADPKSSEKRAGRADKRSFFLSEDCPVS